MRFNSNQANGFKKRVKRFETPDNFLGSRTSDRPNEVNPQNGENLVYFLFGDCPEKPFSDRGW